jgi:DNA-binding NarL/FixJ family response regulator
MTTYVLERPTVRQDPTWLDALTPREREVLGLIALGRTNTEIARDLVVSMATVKTHVARLMRKTAARDRVDLVVRSWTDGVVGR